MIPTSYILTPKYNKWREWEVHNKGDMTSEKYYSIIFDEKYNKSVYACYLRINYYIEKTVDRKVVKQQIKRMNFLMKELSHRNEYPIDGIKNISPDDLDISCLSPPFLSDYYGMIARWYARNEKNKEAFEYYKKYQFYSIHLKSEFEDSKFVELYSFRPMSVYSLADLANRTITVCNPKVMNDPFDSLFFHWIECITLEDKRHAPFKESFKYFKIRSFVKDDLKSPALENITMWSHYADSHKGFCIKYRFSYTFAKGGCETVYSHQYLKSVIYTAEERNLNCKRINSNIAYATKYSQWKYENEVRLIRYDPTCDCDFQSVELDESSKIEAIYFGYRCSDEDIKMIKYMLGDTVEYYKMKSEISNIYQLKEERI